MEATPDGDITLTRGPRTLAGKQITLTGNIQMRELYASDEDYIARRVRQIIAEAGPPAGW